MIFLVFIAVFLLLGGVLYSGRGAAMIAGYNTLPKTEKVKYNERALARFMGRIMFGLAFSMLFWVLSGIFGVGWLFWFGLILFCGILVFALIYANTGDHFRKGEG